MNLREAAELAMWTLESTGTDPSDPKQAIQYNRELKTIERLRQALAQLEDEERFSKDWQETVSKVKAKLKEKNG